MSYNEHIHQIFSSYSAQKLRYGPLTLNIRMCDTSHKRTICVNECLMNMSSNSVPKMRYGPLTVNIKTCAKRVKITQA